MPPGSCPTALRGGCADPNRCPAIWSNPLLGFSSLCELKINTADSLRKLGLAYHNSGGEGGIRTLDGVLPHTPLAGERLQPLGHLSNSESFLERDNIMFDSQAVARKSRNERYGVESVSRRSPGRSSASAYPGSPCHPSRK